MTIRKPPRATPAYGSRDREFVQGLERGLGVLKAFSAETPRLTVTGVAAQAGLTRAVARRYLLTLKSLGYVAQDGDRGGYFSLTPRVLDFGFAYLSAMGIAAIARPFMEQVADTLRENCSIAVIDGRDVVYLARVTAKRIIGSNVAVGSRLPAHCTSMGKIFLAAMSPADLAAFFAGGPLKPMTARSICQETRLRHALAEVRSRGYAFNDGESEEGIRGVAAPIFDRSGHLHAAMNVAGLASRVSMKELRARYLPILLEATDGISRALGADRHQLENRNLTQRLSRLQFSG